jgi:hypothetical protein
MAEMIERLLYKKISLTVSYMGQPKPLTGTLLGYTKPFILLEMKVKRTNGFGIQERYINENTIKEIFVIEPEQSTEELHA